VIHSPAPVSSGSGSGALKGNSRPKHASEPGRDKAVSEPPRFVMGEQLTSKDYRSFAANLFGTVAFKMLEWLTPAAIEEMSRTARLFYSDSENPIEAVKMSEPSERPENCTTTSRQEPAREPSAARAAQSGEPRKAISTDKIGNEARDKTERPEKLERDARTDYQREPTSVPGPGTQRRNSNAKVRTSSATKSKRQLSIDPFATDSLGDDPFSGLLRSPRASGGQPDRNTRGIKPTGSTLSRPISQLSSAGYFDDVTLEKMPPPKHVDIKPKPGRAQLDGPRSNGSSSPKEPVASGVASDRSCSTSSARADEESETDDDSLYPQALSRLNADIVDFICDAMQEDGSAEKHLLEPPAITRFHNRYTNQGKPLKRKSRPSRTVSANLKAEWKLFMEQTLFYVLSQPQNAIRSFSIKGQLYDSQTLWYCMLRLTRIAPTLVLHSLWMAAASLFAPPKALQYLRSPTAKLFPKHADALSNVEAGRLMSICLHALVAIAPLVNDSGQLYDMSRIRSHGLSLAGSGSVAQQPAFLCLQYEDAFTDDLALRLARRLFAAIVTRRCYDEVNETALDAEEAKERDVLAPLFSQLDFLSIDAAYILNFSFPDRALHESRMPILLLDWARAVMLNEWSGNPEVPGDGPFGGALAFIEAMRKY